MALSFSELQRKNSHADQVGAVNSFIRCGDHSLDTQQKGPFGCPVSGRTTTVLAPRKCNKWRLALFVLLGRFVDGHDLITREVGGIPSFCILGQLVLQPDVGKSTPGHHAVITPSSSVGVEIPLLYTILDQILTGRTVNSDVTCR